MGIGLDQPSHWAIIAIAFLLLFGYKKLPDMARSAGRSMRVFKTELKGLNEDDAARDAEKAAAATPAPEQLPAPLPPAVAQQVAEAPAPPVVATPAPPVVPAPPASTSSTA